MPSRNLVAFSLVAVDAALFVVLFNLMSLLRGIITSDHLVLTPLLVPVILVIFALYLIDGYKTRTDMLSLDYASLHVIALGSALLATLLAAYVIIPSGYTFQQSRSVTVLSFVLFMPATLYCRRLFFLCIHRDRHERSLVFLGDPTSCLEFKNECARQAVGQPILLCTSTTEERSSGPDLHAFDEVVDRLTAGDLKVEAIVLRESRHNFDDDLSSTLVGFYFDGLPTYTLEMFHQIYWRKIPLYRLNHIWLFQEGFQIAREPVFEHLKRISDIFFSSIGILLALPLVTVAAAIIKIEDGGPVFFRQTRIGRNRVPFSLFKLRTMRTAEDGDRYTQKNDPRITRIGSFLRASRIDEIPQLLNVLRGEMSLIGPRAEWDKLVADYEKQIPCYHFRHLIRPGITGWAQVNYPYGANLDDTLRKLEYDLYYIRHFSLILDASIILKTVHIMLFGKGR